MLAFLYNFSSTFSSTEYNLFFGGNSYLTINNPDLRDESKVVFNVRPESDNGVLFYTSDSKRKKVFDFMSVSLVDGFVEFK